MGKEFIAPNAVVTFNWLDFAIYGVLLAVIIWTSYALLQKKGYKVNAANVTNTIKNCFETIEKARKERFARKSKNDHSSDK